VEADFSVELGPAAPALEMPWEDPAGQWSYLNLRQHPERAAELPEAAGSPALQAFLRAVNAPSSPLESAKCDRWIDQEAGSPGIVAAGGYIDLIFRDAEKQLSLPAHEAFARDAARRLRDLDDDGNLPDPSVAAEFVIRRCYYHAEKCRDISRDGYSITLFLNATATDEPMARQLWEDSLRQLTPALLAL
jgi:hypothetical protein